MSIAVKNSDAFGFLSEKSSVDEIERWQNSLDEERLRKIKKALDMAKDTIRDRAKQYEARAFIISFHFHLTI
ncbi:uncharacterized protein FOMMEDRAFT_159522 [Fomitiporia mediterranea MF3/22]|uniref:uncharacterized protein n=1 Tax=Fomitiporia mediterranea (strain MF3/22) TaxID=694068 RepID=UPI0004407D5F|nr:uncharacterized protein FOMMEDRAFT_159522 [Fomitiporia mediterranea MF3/22]EJC99945.1 hypothetical protein FOMMEDRAFT_159522 [Fomitiporia mediterranea MF3/22]